MEVPPPVVDRQASAQSSSPPAVTSRIRRLKHHRVHGPPLGHRARGPPFVPLRFRVPSLSHRSSCFCLSAPLSPNAAGLGDGHLLSFNYDSDSIIIISQLVQLNSYLLCVSLLVKSNKRTPQCNTPLPPLPPPTLVATMHVAPAHQKS